MCALLPGRPHLQPTMKRGWVVLVEGGGGGLDCDVCWPESIVSRGSAHHLSDILKRKMNVE